MVKNILKWTVYAGIVGLLIFGGVIRTQAKAGQEIPRAALKVEDTSAESQGQGGEGGGSSREKDEETTRGGQGAGKNADSTGNGEEVHLAEEEVHDWLSLTGYVIALDPESLWIEIDQEQPLEITGRAWRFILEAGFLVEIGDEMDLEGFLENEEFEVSAIWNLTAGTFLQIREESGRPLWSGGRGR